MPNRKTVERWMRANAQDHTDPYAPWQINATGLTEAAAAALDLYETDADYSIDDSWYDLAADVADWYERQQP